MFWHVSLWFTLYWTLYASWTCVFPSPRKGNIQPLFLQVSFYLSLPSPWIPIMGMWVCLILSTKCIKLSSNFGLIFPFWCWNWVIYTTMYFSLLMFPSESSNLLMLPLYFSCQLFYSSIIISSFLYLLPLCGGCHFILPFFP